MGQEVLAGVRSSPSRKRGHLGREAGLASKGAEPSISETFASCSLFLRGWNCRKADPVNSASC